MNRRPRYSAAVLAVAAALSACSDDAVVAPTTSAGGSHRVATTTTVAVTTPGDPEVAATTASAPATSVVATQAPTTESATSTAPPETVPATLPAVGNPVVAVQQIAALDAPVALAVRPGDEALYVAQQAGGVVRLGELGASPATLVADLSDLTSANGEQGLLGLAFSPDGGRAYVNYTDNRGDTTIAEYPVAADGAFDTGAARLLMVIPQPYPNHNGGDLTFGPDGMLYIATGDGGAANDPERRASDPTQLLGMLLRIDPTPTPDGSAYTIPADNPFADGEHEGVVGAPEVWSWGLRNPWRIAFDPATADLWIADVGQNVIEEVSVVSATDRPAGYGANFGWSAYEGADRFNTDVDDPGNLVFPVVTYRHGDDGCSISGGAVYRGAAIAELAGAYVYGDFCSGKVWALDLAGGRNLTLLDVFSELAAIRTGPDGELYVLELSGGLHRLVQG